MSLVPTARVIPGTPARAFDGVRARRAIDCRSAGSTRGRQAHLTGVEWRLRSPRKAVARRPVRIGRRLTASLGRRSRFRAAASGADCQFSISGTAAICLNAVSRLNEAGVWPGSYSFGVAAVTPDMGPELHTRAIPNAEDRLSYLARVCASKPFTTQLSREPRRVAGPWKPGRNSAWPDKCFLHARGLRREPRIQAPDERSVRHHLRSHAHRCAPVAGSLVCDGR